jgi:hypothetical protein
MPRKKRAVLGKILPRVKRLKNARGRKSSSELQVGMKCLYNEPHKYVPVYSSLHVIESKIKSTFLKIVVLPKTN